MTENTLSRFNNRDRVRYVDTAGQVWEGEVTDLGGPCKREVGVWFDGESQRDYVDPERLTILSKSGDPTDLRNVLAALEELAGKVNTALSHGEVAYLKRKIADLEDERVALERRHEKTTAELGKVVYALRGLVSYLQVDGDTVSLTALENQVNTILSKQSTF